MGKLIDRSRRDRARADRPAHQALILEGARQALLSQPPGDLTLEMLDRAAGLRQGSASLHFGSLDSLIIRLLREETTVWLERLESVAQEGRRTLSPHDLAGVLTTTLQQSPLFCRLVAALPAIADRSTIEMDRILDLETRRLRQFRKTGAIIESLCPSLNTGDGVIVLRRAVLLAGALEPLVNPPSCLLLAMDDKALSPLYPDAVEELRTLLRAVLSAMCD